MQFIAMNRFKVIKEEQQAFEERWLNREVHIAREPGFVAFHLLKGPEYEDHILYASHTVWESEEAFDAWTRSEAFRAAHHSTGTGKRLHLSNAFEGFNVLQEVGPAKNEV